jgi:N-acetylglutamate synthase-like GNAT family acetyltransferase
MIEIRRATPVESDQLTALAHAAKRHWNYPQEWIDYWESDLTLPPEFIANNEVFVAITNDIIVGCCALIVNEGLVELEHMWIDPEQMGRGVGRALFEYASRRASELGFRELELSADPNAEPFYARMGAQRIGEIPADMFGQARVLPRMRVHLSSAPTSGRSNL